MISVMKDYILRFSSFPLLLDILMEEQSSDFKTLDDGMKGFRLRLVINDGLS